MRTSHAATTIGNGQIQTAAINASSAGANTIVAAHAGQRIVVLGYHIVSADAVSLIWESSGGTVLSGPVSAPAAGWGVERIPIEAGRFTTVAGEGLVLYLGGAVQVGGDLQYVVI